MSTESLRSRKPAEGKEDHEREERTGNHRGGKRRGELTQPTEIMADKSSAEVCLERGSVMLIAAFQSA